MRDVYRATRVYMDTFVTVEVVSEVAATACAGAAERAFGWFAEVESRCSRFDPESELRRLTSRPGEVVPVSPVLYEAVSFALAVARASRGAFDPTVGQAQEARGFDRNFRTGRAEPSGLPPGAAGWRHVRLDPRRRTIALARPLLLDLGGVAKGLAIDLAARELLGFPGFVVEAGGDLLAHGGNADGTPWRIGIRHPRQPEAVCTLLGLRDVAICTSGDYERRTVGAVEHHLLDPRTGRSPAAVASCSVVAPSAMLADALSTAASVLGPEHGTRWLERQGVEGLFITPALEMRSTRGFARYEPCLR